MDRRDICRKALPMVREAAYQLEQAQQKLSSARNWGIFDLLGGGFISTLVKHSKVDDANDCIRHAARLMERVGDMLPEIDAGDAPLEEGGFRRFADLVFDGLWSDLYMQGKINDQRAAVERMLERVRAAERAIAFHC